MTEAEIRQQLATAFPTENQVPKDVALTELVDGRRYLVNGEIRSWSGPIRPVYSPIRLQTPTGLQPKQVGNYALCTEKEALEALDAACQAFDKGRGKWPTMSVASRILHFENFTYRMQEQRDKVVKLLMWEIGKSLSDSEKEFDRTLEYVKDTISAMKDLDRNSSRFCIEQGVLAQIRRSPLGVVLCMGPFNYPLNETFTTLIPALIMGNTVVFKPPKLGTLLHLPLLEAFRDCFPPGVVNTVYGNGSTVIPPLMASGKIDVLAFIGTSPVANDLRRQHPQAHRLRCVLGLEAKNPAIILADADLDLAVRETILGTLSFNGQRCTALKMLWVQKSVAEAYLQKLVQAVDNLRVGMPWDPEIQITPLPEPHKPEYLQGLIEDALSKGAQVLNAAGGSFHHSLFYPAVLYPVNSQMAIYHEEQFGPVIPVSVFDDIQEPIDYINDSTYGQQVSIFGSDPQLISQLIDPLVNQVCRVNLNSQCQRGPDTFPFTGRKNSGEGTLSVADALRSFSIRTLVAAKDEKINKEIINEILTERKSNFLSTDFIL